ncbi:MAG TPA: hypothetical protein VEP89_13900, partial [Draconibacterium sp.]|nr:hypothetical protein [Draconibacterium sp.]
MANYSFNLRGQYKPGTEDVQKEIRKITDAKKRNRKLQSILSLEQVPVRLTVSVDRAHRFHCTTDLKVFPKQWDFKEKRMKWQATGAQNFNQRLNDILESVQNYYTELMQQENTPSFEQVRDLMLEYVSTKTKPRFTDNEITFFEVYDEFLKRKEKELHHRTIQKFNSSK